MEDGSCSPPPRLDLAAQQAPLKPPQAPVPCTKSPCLSVDLAPATSPHVHIGVHKNCTSMGQGGMGGDIWSTANHLGLPHPPMLA